MASWMGRSLHDMSGVVDAPNRVMRRPLIFIFVTYLNLKAAPAWTPVFLLTQL